MTELEVARAAAVQQDRHQLAKRLRHEADVYWPQGLPESAIEPKAQHVVLGLRIAIGLIEGDRA